MKPKVLFITTDYPPGVGGQSRLSEYIVSSLQDEFDLKVYLQLDTPPPHTNFTTLQTGTGNSCLTRWINRCDLAPSFLRSCMIAKYLGRDFDLVIAGDSERSAWTAGWFRLLFRAPRFINFCQGMDFAWRNYDTITGRLHRFLLSQSACSIASSQETASRITSLRLSRNVSVVSPPVDLARFKQIPKSENILSSLVPADFKGVIISTVSRLVARKGVDRVIRALANLERDFLYMIAGDGPERASLEKLAKELGLAQKIIFLSEIEDEKLPHFYNLSDFFVLTPFEIHDGAKANFEGFGMVFLEANACGKPVIATSSGGIPDAVHDGYSALVIPPNDPESLKKALLTLIDDSDLRNSMSSQAIEWASRFALSSMREKYRRFFSQHLATHPSL